MKTGNRKKHVISFPRYGKYTNAIVGLARRLGGEVIEPPPITKRTIEYGTKYSPSDVCYPFKVTLGTIIEELEQGAEMITVVNSAGWCILRCYHAAQEMILKDLGYSFRMVNMNVRNPFKTFKSFREMFPGITPLEFLKESKEFFREISELDSAEEKVNRDAGIKIGIIGEIYVCNENMVNHDMVSRLQGMGIYVNKSLSLSNSVVNMGRDFLRIKELTRRKKKAWEYFPERIGGHANENLVRLIEYAECGYDGIVMIKPFACNPETIIEPAVERISRDYDLPVLFLTVDESTVETHFQTRIESFVDMLKMRRGAF
jgi:predicted nucleotide-binding protein (sugar kinase/HSP70/actin superfamily)